jgi:hypothetical protein
MKIDKIVFILLLSCLSFSCGRKETKERMRTYADAEKEFVGSLTKTDSITVLEMSQKCMDSLKAGNIEAALGMLYVVKDGEAVRLTNENAENLSVPSRLWIIIWSILVFPLRDVMILNIRLNLQRKMWMEMLRRWLLCLIL